MLNITINKIESKLDNITLRENVDKIILQRLLRSKYLLDDDEHNDTSQLKNYLKKITKKGYVSVKYQKKKGISRTYSNKGLSYQLFRKALRHTLCSDYYMDIDIVNAHFVMLNQICKENGIDTTELKKYINNREEYLNELIKISGVDRDDAKLLFIRMLYGGSIENWKKDNKVEFEIPKYYKELEKNIKNISMIIFNSNSDFRKSIKLEKRNIPKSVLSYYLQEWENRILEVVYDYLNENDYIVDKIATLCFDGIMTKKSKDILKICDNLEKIVEEKLGFKLKFIEKKFDKVIKEIINPIDEEYDDIGEGEISNNLKMYRYILKYSNDKKLKKNQTHILKPSNTSPIVYENYMEFNDFINLIFCEGSKYYNLFRNSPMNFNNMIKYLEQMDDIELPFIRLNKYIISFKNGYINIEDLYDIKFINYEDLVIDNDTITSIHYNFDFDLNLLDMNMNDIKTPLFDKICNYHFEDEEILNIFYGMLGRLHYNTNKYDKFNCMVFIKGGANTGKSTTGNICMNNHQNIGTISGKMEKTFGLQSLRNKNVIYNPDMNQNFVEKVDKGDFQRLIEGSTLDIPVKNKPSINNYKWEIPLLFLGNYLPNYKDSSGAIPRRIAIFYMDKYLNSRDTSIEKRCIDEEGHLILIKTLLSYRWLIEKYKNQTFEDWELEYFKEGYEEMTNKCNNLYNYLKIPYEDFETWTSYKEGNVVAEKELKEAVEKYYYMNSISEKFDCNKTTLSKFGYIVKSVYICSNCGKKPTGKKKIQDKCCNKYTRKNRRKRKCIVNIKIHRKYEDMNDSEEEV
jgi:hypothetical protein